MAPYFKGHEPKERRRGAEPWRRPRMRRGEVGVEGPWHTKVQVTGSGTGPARRGAAQDGVLGPVRERERQRER